MELRRFRRWCLSLSVLFATFQLRAEVTGSISGYVRDPSGTALAGATLTIDQQSTGYTRTVETDVGGQYRFPALPPGRYRLTATLDKFQSEVIDDIDLSVNDQLPFDVSLKVGSIVESVTVEADNLQVQTESTQLGTTIQSNQILAMPLNGRSYLDLLSLRSGVAPSNTNGNLNDRSPASGLYSSSPSASGNVSTGRSAGIRQRLSGERSRSQ